jgi:hypothetical protein
MASAAKSYFFILQVLIQASRRYAALTAKAGSDETYAIFLPDFPELPGIAL